MGRNCDTTFKDAKGLTPKEFLMRFYKDVSPTFVAAYERCEIRDILETS